MPGEGKDILKFWNGNLFQKLSFQKEVKKEDFANTALQNIFELADSDKNNVLDSSELSIFYDKVRQAAGEDSTLSEEEAVNFLSETSPDTPIKPVVLLDFFSTILTGNKGEKLSTSDEIDFDSRLSDLQINQNYTRKDLTDMHGYPYQMIFDGNKLIGIISRNNVRFYTEETKGEIYSLNGVYECDFVQEGTDAPEGEFIPEKRYYRDGSIVECDKYGNRVIYNKAGKAIEEHRTETTLEGNSLDISINREAGLKRVLNSSVEGAVYNKEGDVVYNIYSDLDSEGRVVLQTHEYADGRVVVGSSSNVLSNLTVEEKSVLSKNYIARLKEDISQALQILRDYESGKGILGSTAQLFMKDGSTVDSKISYYESMLSKLNSLDGLSQEEFETAFKKIFGTDFNYNRAYSLTRINEKLSSAVRLTQTISAIDSLISADNSAALTPMDQILKSRMDSISTSSEISKFSKDFQNREFAQQAHKVLSIILGDEKLAQEYMIGVYRQAGSEEKAEQILRESLSEIKNNLNNELSTLTKGKGIEFLQKQANAVYKEAFAGDKIFSEDASALVESYMLTEAYLETGITVAVSLATMGTGAVASIGRACVSRLGTRVGNLVAKTLVTALNAAVPSALTYVDDATSGRGITSATHAEALEEFKSGMKYGTFGTFVSSPLGNAITKFAGTKGINSLAANCIGTGIETSADVVFDRMTTDLSLKDSFMQNGGMNFAMMFLGGQIAKQLGARELEKLNKRIEQELQNIKITRNSDGTCCLSANGKVLADKVSPAYALGVMISQAKAKVETALEVSKLGAGVSEPAVVTLGRADAEAKSEPEQTISGNNVEAETVAPFAKHLEQTPDIQELTNPEIKKVQLENGEFDENGNFISDGTYTITESGNPLAKSETFMRYPDKDYKIAENVDELVEQILKMPDEQKLDKQQYKSTYKYRKTLITDFIKQHPEISVSELSVILNDFNHITGANPWKLFESYRGISQIKDIKQFKTNLSEYDKFITDIKASGTDDELINKLRNLAFMTDMAQIKPEDFRKNLEFFKTLDNSLCSDLMRGYNQHVLFKPHTDKYFERIQTASEFNRFIENADVSNPEIIKFGVMVRGFENYTNEEFAQITKNIELVKDMINNNCKDSKFMSMVINSRDALYTNCAEKLKQQLGDNFDYNYLDKIGNCPLEVATAIINAFPKGAKNMNTYHFWSLANVYNKLDDSGKKNFMTKIALAAKLPQFVEYNGKLAPGMLERYMQKEIPNADKIMEFASLVEHCKDVQIAKLFERSDLDIIQKTLAEIDEQGKGIFLEHLPSESKITVDKYISLYNYHKETGTNLPWDEDILVLGCKLVADKEFPREQIAMVLQWTRKDSIELAREMVADKEFPREQIADVLISVLRDKDNRDFARELVKDKEFPREQIANVLLSTIQDKDNIDFARELIKDKEFPREQIAMVLRWTRKDKGNIELARELVANKEFPREQIAKVLQWTNKDNIELARKLVANKEFPREQIAKVLRWTNKDNIDFARELVANKEFPRHEIARVLFTINKDNIDFARELVANKEFPRDQIANVLFSTTKDNIDFARELVANKEFPRDQIANVLFSTTKDNIDLARELVANKEFPRDCIHIILENPKDRLGLARKLVANKEFPRDQIANVLKYITNDNIEKVQELYKRFKQKNINLDYMLNILSSGAVDYIKWMDRPISSMSKSEKRMFMSDLVLYKNKEMSAELAEHFPAVPKTETEYIELMQRLSNALNISVEKLSPEKCAQFRTTLKSFEQNLAEMDLSTLDSVSLRITHQDFISKTESLLSKLNLDEQYMIKEFYGFDIRDGHLIGYPDYAGKSPENLNLLTPEAKATAEEIRTIIEQFKDNNFITIKKNPELEAQLRALSLDMPEFYNQIDGSTMPVNTLKTLQKIINNPKYKQLNESDKRILMLATLLHNTDKYDGTSTDSGFDAYFIAQKFGFTDEESAKLYAIIQGSNTIEKFMSTNKEKIVKKLRGIELVTTVRENTFERLAFDLKEGNIFELTQMLYSAKDVDGLTRHLDRMLEKRISEIKANDFVLPQTPSNTYLEMAKSQEVRGHQVQVVNASDIENFYALIHTPETSFASKGQSRTVKFANFEAFNNMMDDKIICTSYIANGALCGANIHGFIFDVPNEKQYVGMGHDIFSLCKNVNDMLTEYYKPNGIFALQNKGEKFYHRTMISDNLKKILGLSDSEYIKRLDNIKAQLGSQTMTIENIMEIDPEFGKAYKKFLSRNTALYDRNALLRNDSWNEVLVSNPKISAIFTYDLDNIPEEYLIKAQTENLPIVVLKK